MKVVLASNNQGKIKEFQKILSKVGINITPQKEFYVDSADETGLTFVENAILKARHASRQTTLPAIADDSGLQVDFLKGAPGIYSARFAGEKASDEENNDYLLQRLATVPKPLRTARYQAVIVFLKHYADPKPIICEAHWEGLIATDHQGNGGFGYDPLFIPSGQTLSAAEMKADAKNKVSHRGRALSKLIDYFADSQHILCQT
ncbi:MAG: non-canonical purine NTP pyrophosphatase, RdgB/HAM1 family [Cellvibrionales bacterium TMED49]|nr:non-canonical purine NTP pyrophosphatase, RdgB/HAM1 family [Porticoccaceae bacterium]OUU38638.1 MAG: non-canonical purine NTP pyrophosphatase, RdgB/HAM1 family [Cellvibrionales bacterium TMED49]|tara:strand:+ start:117 stop:728 length:612 start_codon:yes stop_codon:yes gene_type:complete